MDLTLFLDKLDSLPSAEMERFYSTTEAPLRLEDVPGIVRAHRPCAAWLWFRVFAGPPGAALPSPEAAFERIMSDSGDLADAYTITMTMAPLPPLDELHLILTNAALTALKAKGGFFFAWLASRAAIASFIAGDQERTWFWLKLEREGDSIPTFEDVKGLLPLREVEGLETCVWTRRAVWGHWPSMAPRSMPHLPRPKATGEEMTRNAWSALVKERMPGDLQEWLHAGLHAHDVALAEELEDHASVRAIRQAVLRQDRHLLEGLEIPDEFIFWVLRAWSGGQYSAARLGAWLIVQQDPAKAGACFSFLLPEADADDLSRLVPMLPDTLREVAEELSTLLPDLPPDLRKPILLNVALPKGTEHFEACEELFQHRDKLRLLLRPDRPFLASLVEWLDKWPEGKAPAREEVAALERALSWLRDRFPEPEGVEAKALLAAVKHAPAVAENGDLLCDLSSRPSWDVILMCVLLLHAWKGDHARAHLRDKLTSLILETEVTHLFPIRLQYLQESLHAASHDRERAFLLFGIVNTWNALAPDDVVRLKQNMALLENALDLAARAGDGDLLADGVSLLVRTVSLGPLADPDDGDAIRRRMLTSLADMAKLPLSDTSRGTVAWATSRILTSPGSRGNEMDFEAARPFLERAVALLPDDHWRLDVMRELSHVLRVLGQPAEALVLAREALDAVPPGTAFHEQGLLHAEVAECLVQVGQDEDAEDHFREAMRLVGDAPRTALVAIHLAFLLARRGAAEEAWNLLDRLEGHRERLPLLDRIEVARLRYQLAKARRDAAATEAALRNGLACAAGTVWEPVFLLESAALGRDDLSLVDVVRGYLEGHWPISSHGDEALEHATVRLLERLPSDVVDALASWADRRGSDIFLSHVLEARGDERRAATRLRGAILRSQDPEERIEARLRLIELTPRTEIVIGRDLIRGVEGDLSAIPSPRADVLANLGAACNVVADGDMGWLHRALVWSEQAFQRSDPGQVRRHAASTALAAVRNLLVASLPRSSVEQALLIRRVVPLVPDAGLCELAAEIVVLAVIAGRLAHPDLVDAGDALLDVLPDSPTCVVLRERIRSIRAFEGSARVAPLPSPWADRDNFDDCPEWMVQIVRGQQAEIGCLARLDSLATAVQIRPDCADAMVSHVFRTAESLDPPAQGHVLEILAELVREGEQSADAWPELFGLVRGISPTPSNRPLHELYRALLRARRFGDDDNPGSVEEALRDADAQGVELGPKDYFDRAVAAMDQVQRSPDPDSNPIRKASAIADLERALEGWRGHPHEVDALISLGNALRLPPDPDFEGAIATYEQVSAMGPDPGEHLGRLHKVWADALHERGREGDLLSAWEHVQIALHNRPNGWLRAETLFCAARLAAVHPAWDEARRNVEEARLLMDAVREDPKVSHQALVRLLRALANWGRREPGNQERISVLDELHRIYPDERVSILNARKTVTRFHPALAPDVAETIKDPDLRAVFEVNRRLKSEREVRQSIHSPDLAVDSTHGMVDELFRDDVAQMKAYLVDLDDGTDADRVGRLVARVILLGHLCHRSEVGVEQVREATHVALVAVRGADLAPRVRSNLLCSLATVWSPIDHAGGAVRDFAWSCQLAHEAQDTAPKGSYVEMHALECLVRGYRYRTDGDLRANLVKARSCCETLLEKDRALGLGPQIANTLNLLVDLEIQLGEGSEASRLRHNIALLREAVGLAVDDDSKSLYQGNLAWYLTKLAGRVSKEEGLQQLREADALFEEAMRLVEDGGHSLNFEDNRTVCQDMLALLQGDRETGPRLFRELLARRIADGYVASAANVEHNLADALCRLGGKEHVLEAVKHFRHALQFRTLESDPRFHWESKVGVARACMRLLDMDKENRETWFVEARAHLRDALRAARVLGEGTELQWASVDLVDLSVHAGTAEGVQSLAEEGFGALKAASPWLMFDLAARTNEAEVAKRVAFALTDHLGREGIIGALNGGFVLHSSRAEKVLRWLLRSDAPYHRLLEARLRPPSALTPEDSLRWKKVLAEGDPLLVNGSLKEIHRKAPGWLASDPTLAETRRWLRTNPGSVVMGVWPGARGVLVVLMEGDERIAVLALSAPPIPLSEDQVAKALRNEEDRGRILKALITWTRTMVTERIQGFIGRQPSRILWVPHGAMRLAPPHALFPGTSVIVSASLALRPSVPVRSRTEEVALVLADPGKGQGHLGAAGLQAMSRLAASVGGPVRMIAGVGKKYGGDVLPGASAIRPGARQVVQAFDHAGVAVVLAHGQVNGPDDAWIECLSANGEVERLDASILSEDPGALADLSVILLSCETGRTGDAPDGPGGIAGAMLLSGAREVVAPLWPVGLEAAVHVGTAILDGRRKKVSAAEALARIQVDDPGGPRLGPPPSVEAQRTNRALDTLAFVTWVG